jgi:hypothetical protein
MLRPILKNLPSWVQSFTKELSSLITLERDLWMELLKDARSRIDDGKLNPSEAM